MRLSSALIAIAAFAAAPAGAQTSAELSRLRLQTLQQQNIQAQALANIVSRQNADLNEALAAQQRTQTQLNLSAIQPSARAAPAPAPAVAPDRLTSDAEAMLRLQDKTLADSNAKLRAITPAQ